MLTCQNTENTVSVVIAFNQFNGVKHAINLMYYKWHQINVISMNAAFYELQQKSC